MEKTDRPYDPQLIGIVSKNPAMVLGEKGENSRPVALVGRVPIKVSTINGEIEIGDYLTSSEIPGVAMKATKPGRVIGMALESYSGEGIGWVNVFLNPHFVFGSINSDGSFEDLFKEIQNKFTSTQITEGLLEKFISLIKSALEKLGLFIENGIAKVKRLITQVVEVDKIQMRDQATGEIYCTWIENGEWVKVKGECDGNLKSQNLDLKSTSQNLNLNEQTGNTTSTDTTSTESATEDISSKDTSTEQTTSTSQESNLTESLSTPNSDNQLSTESTSSLSPESQTQ